MSKRKTKKIIIANHGSYPFDVLVCIDCSVEDVEKKIIELGIKLQEEDKKELSMRGNGKCIMLDGGQTIIRLNKYGNKEFISDMAHEVFHAVEFLFDRIRIKHDVDKSGEAYAYQIGHLIKQII